MAADVRLVLEVHDIDPANPASEIAASTVLYDGVLTNCPGFCTYALVDAINLQCAVAFTRMLRAEDTEVRSAPQGEAFRTRLVGSLKDGAECNVTSSSELEFFTEYVPAASEAIEVRYRGSGRGQARVTSPASIAARKKGIDNGVHGVMRRIKQPPARTAADCENAALAILDDSTGVLWDGTYKTWSDFLPGNASDIFPGDALNIAVPSRCANFVATVREVNIALRDLSGDHYVYTLTFANDAAQPLAFQFEAVPAATLPTIDVPQNEVGTTFLSDLSEAEITQISSTTLTIDAGSAPPTGGGFEVRWSDSGWGPDNDRNLVGRFTSPTFTIPRLSKVQDCYLRQYDSSNPPKYSRYTTALHVDYPL